MSALLCSCVILNYNDAETTIALVNRICGYVCLRHIIVVDNCSSDDSWERLEAIRGIHKVITIKSEKNGGYGYGNNYGVRYAVERLGERQVLIANPDVFFSEDCLNACMQTMKCHPDCGVVAPVQLDTDGKRAVQYAWNISPGLRTLLQSEFLLRHTLFPLPCVKVDFSEPEKEVDCVPGSFLLVDGEKFLQAGGYQESMFLYFEEMMLGYRMRKVGWKTLLLPQQSYLHLHAVSVRRSIPKTVTQRKIQNESLLIYLNETCGYGPVRLMIAKWFLKFCLQEEKILGRFRQKEGGIIEKEGCNK